jgi:hypothetical protein
MKKLSDNVVDSILNVVEELESEGIIDPYDYTGGHESECPKPLMVSIGGKELFEVEYIMNVRSNGDYDGVQGMNVKFKGE